MIILTNNGYFNELTNWLFVNHIVFIYKKNQLKREKWGKPSEPRSHITEPWLVILGLAGASSFSSCYLCRKLPRHFKVMLLLGTRSSMRGSVMMAGTTTWLIQNGARLTIVSPERHQHHTVMEFTRWTKEASSGPHLEVSVKRLCRVLMAKLQCEIEPPCWHSLDRS